MVLAITVFFLGIRGRSGQGKQRYVHGCVDILSSQGVSVCDALPDSCVGSNLSAKPRPESVTRIIISIIKRVNILIAKAFPDIGGAMSRDQRLIQLRRLSAQ